MMDYIIYKDHAGNMHSSNHGPNVSVAEIKQKMLAKIGSEEDGCTRENIFNYDSNWNDWYAFNEHGTLRIVAHSKVPPEFLLTAALLKG